MVNRRGFLKLLAAVPASFALPVPNFVLAAPAEIVAGMPITLGAIRALHAYDIQFDRSIIRLDAYNGKDQFGVDFMVSGPDMRQAYLRARAITEQALMDALKREKWMASDMIALPVPSGYELPEWMT